MFSREERLIGKEALEKLENSLVVIVGVGGVGGYITEILARAGIGNIILIDGDTIDISNVNRQIIATTKNVGVYKVDAWKNRILEINPNCKVEVYPEFYSKENKIVFPENTTYIADAIDSIQDKVELICDAKGKGINIIGAMGAGNRIDPCDFQICDIYKTKYDGLAKKLRSLLKEKRISRLDVCCANAPAIKHPGEIGSISYNPALSGVKIGAYIIEKIIK